MAALKYLASVLYVIASSYIYTVKYTYVADIFPSAHFGVLIGLMAFVSGALNLLHIPLGFLDIHRGICIVYLVGGLVCFFILGYLTRRQRSGYHYKEAEPRYLKEQRGIDAFSVVEDQTLSHP